MNEQNLIPELYRTEYGKIVSLLCNRFGIAFIDNAADIVSDTFLSAAEIWKIQGVPSKPLAWLYAVAKNKALNNLKHDKVFDEKVRGDLMSEQQLTETEIELLPENITDDQLRMIFAICHPSLPIEAQLSLALRILCGFTIDEISRALLTSTSNVNKKLFRAKEKLRTEKVAISFPGKKEIGQRLDTVLVTIYLLFNEGYYSAGTDLVLRKDFCAEAMRLTYLLAEHKETAKPKVDALIALMCFQASRFDARINKNGEMVLYEDQDSSLWNKELINQGNYFFVKASNADEISRYHLEAAIAWWHTNQTDSLEKWQNILRLYNQLLIIEYSPVAALNRTYALSKVYGKETGIVEAEKLKLFSNRFYHGLLGELYTGIDTTKAIYHLEKAMELAVAQPEKTLLFTKISVLKS